MRYYFLFALLLIGLHPLHAQIMNIEKLRLESDSGWAGQAKGAYNINKSSKKIKQLQTNIHIQYKQDIHTFLMLSDLSFIKAGNENYENNGSQHFRYTRNMNDWMSLEGFAQFQYNQVLKVNFRNLWGGGIRFEAFDKDKFKLYLGNIAMFEHEQHKDKTKENNLRLSYYINLKWKIKEEISVSSIAYFQPKMFNLPDVRILWQSSINFKVLKNLKVGVQHNWMHDAYPPEGVPMVIYSLRNTLSYSF
ncbi:MAG: DUF481 domain-containing protein [Bacteroidales bacterium]|nr:DUF481 domain-containing protein [Bacteroidales bacterium]MCF8326997.1 DUF481 domain-containing protein [Bacteroidales bacterium]